MKFSYFHVLHMPAHDRRTGKSFKIKWTSIKCSENFCNFSQDCLFLTLFSIPKCDGMIHELIYSKRKTHSINFNDELSFETCWKQLNYPHVKDNKNLCVRSEYVLFHKPIIESDHWWWYGCVYRRFMTLHANILLICCFYKRKVYVKNQM